MMFQERRRDKMDGNLCRMGMLLVDSAFSILIPLYAFILGVWQASGVLYPLRRTGYLVFSKALQAIAM